MSTGMSEDEFRKKYDGDYVDTEAGPVSFVDFIKAACKEFKAKGMVIHDSNNASDMAQAKEYRDSNTQDERRR